MDTTLRCIGMTNVARAPFFRVHCPVYWDVSPPSTCPQLLPPIKQAERSIAISNAYMNPDPNSGRRGVDIYAVSTFSMSRFPRSLYVPSFFNNKKEDGAHKVFDDLATRNLRRLLRLE
ncbi:Uncharacterized protein Fot_02782 [Forsythia ovata]|uniref:Uncharacterized protein n=1 Tax=Forsythia ovata TaxID=205694 RepID=A0ABD1X7U5_9LAMI